MGEEAVVYLRIRHPDLDPDEITRDLGLTPEHHWKAGDARPESGSSSASKSYAETYWIAPVSFPSRIEHVPNIEGKLMLAAIVLKSRKALWQKIGDCGRADLLVTLDGVAAANIDLESNTLSLLSGIGLSISITGQSHSAAA